MLRRVGRLPRGMIYGKSRLECMEGMQYSYLYPDCTMMYNNKILQSCEAYSDVLN